MLNRPTTLSVYVPKHQMDKRLIERLERLSKKHDRSVNFLVVKAIAQFLDREERK